MSKFSSPFMAKSPLNRRETTKKEKRLSDKLETTKQESADHYFEGHEDKNYDRKQDRFERKELRTKQKDQAKRRKEREDNK